MEQFLEDVPGFKPYLLEHRHTFDHLVLLEMLEILQQLTFQMKGASQPQFLLELAFLRLVRAYRFRNYLSPEALFHRLEELESKLQAVGLTLAETEDIPPWESTGQSSLPPEEKNSVPPRKTPGPTPVATSSPTPGATGDKGSAGKKSKVAEPAKDRNSVPKEDQEFSWKGLLSNKSHKSFSPEKAPPLPEPPPEEEPELPQGRLSSLQNDSFLQQVLDLFNGRLIDTETQLMKSRQPEYNSIKQKKGYDKG